MAIPKNTAQKPVSKGLEMGLAKLSLGVCAILVAVKFAAYFLTHSNAIFSDALENVVNVLTAGFALYSVHLAHQPADIDHPYGHGKIEFFSAGLEGAMILLAALLIAGEVASSYFNPQARLVTGRLDLGLAILAGALVVNGALGLLLWINGKKHRALTLEANGTHLLSDALDSLPVLAAVAIVRITNWQWIDDLTALLVAGYITWLGLRLIRRSAAGLMDEQDSTHHDLLRKILDSHIGPAGKEPLICSYHKLFHRHSGRYIWVDFHISLPAWWDIDKAHRLASSIEYEIEMALGGDATAHVEPCFDGQCANCKAARAGV